MHLQEVGWGRVSRSASTSVSVLVLVQWAYQDGTINLYVSTWFWKCWCWIREDSNIPFLCSPSKTPDNNESLYFQSFKWDLLFADSVLQNNLGGRRGRDFEFHFIHEETAFRDVKWLTWVHMASKPHHPPRSLGKKERKNSLLKYLKNILKIESTWARMS